MATCDYCLVECRETGLFPCKHVVCRNCGMSQNKCLVCANVGNRKRVRIASHLSKQEELRQNQQSPSESIPKQFYVPSSDLIQPPTKRRTVSNSPTSSSDIAQIRNPLPLNTSTDEKETQPISNISQPLIANSSDDKIQDEKSISSKEKDTSKQQQLTETLVNQNKNTSSSAQNTPSRKSRENEPSSSRNVPPPSRSIFKSKRLQQKHNQKKAASSAAAAAAAANANKSTTNGSKRSNQTPSSLSQDKEKKNNQMKKKEKTSIVKDNDENTLEILHAPTVYDDYRCELIPEGPSSKLPRPALRFSGKLTVRILVKFIRLTLKLVPEKEVTILCSGEQLSNEMTMESIYNYVGSAKKQCMVFQYKIEDKTVDPSA